MGVDVDRLIHLLSDANTGTREGASIKLARMGADAEKAIPEIIKGITDYKTVGNKIAAEVLTWMGPVALPYLAELLDHEKAFVRAETLYGLQSYNDDLTSIMPRVIELLADENRYVRRNALKMLIKQGCFAEQSASAAVPALLALMDDHVNRSYALMALAEIGEPALPAVEHLLADEATLPPRSWACTPTWVLLRRRRVIALPSYLATPYAAAGGASLGRNRSGRGQCTLMLFAIVGQCQRCRNQCRSGCC